MSTRTRTSTTKTMDKPTDQLLLGPEELRLLFEMECDLRGLSEGQWAELWERFREKYMKNTAKRWANLFAQFLDSRATKAMLLPGEEPPTSRPQPTKEDGP